MNILLKRATLDNLEDVAQIEKAASSKTYHALIEKEELIDFINSCEVFLIQKDDKILGLVSFEVKNGVATCNGLVIHPDFRRKGYAREAMSLALDKFKQCNKIDLVVHPHNSPAISLYLSLGFKIEGWKDDCFGDGEPRIVMVFN